MNKVLFLDLETTGFSRQWDYIIEVAAILYDLDTHEELDSFHEYIKPGKKIPAKVVELTGITDRQVAGCRSEKEVLQDFVEWVVISQPKSIIGHNCKSFDLSFIRTKSEYYHLGWTPDKYEIIDTYQMVRQMVKIGKLELPDCKQVTVAANFGIEYEAHSAIEDVRALIKVYDHLLKLNNATNINRAILGF